jgi:beta-phosphoglucomutase-like phosphatase (HAD superfamily)
VGNRKNELLLHAIRTDGVTVFEDARRYLEAARDAGLRRLVVSSSANTGDVLRVTGLEHLVEGRVDGVTIAEQHLRGKPAPDSFLEGARVVGVSPERAVVFEDALSGVAAGKAGGFGCVIGVNRVSEAHGRGLADNGATRVVRTLDELLEGAK